MSEQDLAPPEIGRHIPQTETEIDWARARTFLLRRIRRKLDRLPEDDRQDLVQMALLRLIRTVRLEPARNLEGLMSKIAHDVIVDFLRRRRRWSILLGSVHVTDPSQQTAPCPEQFGDPDERLRFTVMEFFRQRQGSCLELALAFFQETDWRTVASRMDTGYGAVRQKWSRCVALLRDAARKNPGLLLEWSSAVRA